MLHTITRVDIDFDGKISHRVVVYFFNGKKNIIAAVVEGYNPVEVYRKARTMAGVKGRVPVEWLPAVTEDKISRFH